MHWHTYITHYTDPQNASMQRPQTHKHSFEYTHHSFEYTHWFFSICPSLAITLLKGGRALFNGLIEKKSLPFIMEALSVDRLISLEHFFFTTAHFDQGFLCSLFSDLTLISLAWSACCSSCRWTAGAAPPRSLRCLFPLSSSLVLRAH